MEGMKLGATGMWRWIWEALRMSGEYKQNTLYETPKELIKYYITINYFMMLQVNMLGSHF